MKNLLIVLPILFFVACEDTDDGESNSSGSPLVGTWSFVATEYDTTCTGEGEIFESGTMVFEENTATFTSSVTFEEWCEGTITDGVCDEYGNIYELSDFEADWESNIKWRSTDKTKVDPFDSEATRAEKDANFDEAQQKAREADQQDGRDHR